MAKSDCIFCRIVEGAAPARIVAESRLSLALLDIHPLAPGHTLVIPRRHVSWWYDLTAEETADFFELARGTAGRLREVFAPAFVAMFARGRRIPHVHLFLVPTRGGDPLDRHFNAIEGWQEGAAELARLGEPDRMDEIAARIRR